MASEEDFSDSFDEDNTKTLVQVAPRQAAVSPRTKKGKKGPGAKRPASATKGTPYGPYSSRKSKNSRELFIRSLKEGGSQSGSKKDHVGGRTTQQYWSDTLRRTGVGFTTEAPSSESFSGLKKSQSENMSYSSTSHYLRQLAGTEKAGQRPRTDKSKPVPGTPAYKSQEEYYDQIQELKKQIKVLTTENSQMKAKVGRLEKDNSKKEKEIEQLLDPSKSEEMRRTLADRRPDAGAVMHSLKQKILKLEQQLKEKEAAYNKLQSDLKTTKIEELRLQTEAYYKEIIRLNRLKSEDLPTTRRGNGGSSSVNKESPAKLKGMHDTLIKMNERNYQLQVENKSLKQDLEKQMDKQKQATQRTAEYQDMNKKELLSAINKLEKRLDKTEETTSMMSEVESRSGVIEGKIPLQGSAAQRLDQLDRRETELLDELKKKNDLVKKLKEDRTHYRKKCEEKDKEIKLLKKDVEELHAELDGFYDKDKRGASPRMSPRRKKSEPVVQASRVREQKSGSYNKYDREAEEREKEMKYKKQQEQKVEAFKKQRSAKVIQKSWRGLKEQKEEVEERNRKAEMIRKTHAAKTIQKEWRGFKQRQQGEDEAAELIQAYMRAHQTRSKTVKAYQQNSRYYDDEEDSEMMGDSQSDITEVSSQRYSSKRSNSGRRSPVAKKIQPAPRKPQLDEDTVLYLQSTLRAHQARKTYLNNLSDRERPGSRLTSRSGQSGKGLDSAGESEGSDDFHTTTIGSGRMSVTSGHSATSRYNRSKARSPSPKPILSEEDSESDDDIVVVGGKKEYF